MAASAVTPKLLGRISNEKYQPKDKWKIDDITLGPANELLISGHNLEIPETFISMHKEDSGKYNNFPEFNKNFDQTQPGEQLVLYSEVSSIIGLKVESAMQFLIIEGRDVFKTLKWKRSPTSVCFYRGKLYAASSSPTNVRVCNLDSEAENIISLNDMRNDCVLEIVVVMDKIYICTKVAGRALVFSMTGSKEMEFENATRSDSRATSICVHERTELVFVSWSTFQVHLFSQKTSRCLHAFDMTEELHKIRVTTKNRLVTLSASKCTVTVYDVGEVIKIGESENHILSSVTKKHRNKLMSHDEWNLECHSANSETLTRISSPLKSAPKQNLRDTKEWYMQQLEENENLRRKSDRDIQELNKNIEELEVRSKETGRKKKNLEFCLHNEDIEIERMQHEKKQVERERNYRHRQQQQLRNESIELYKKIEEVEVRCKNTGSQRKNRKYSLLKEDIEIANMHHEKTRLQKEKEYLHSQQQQLNYASMELNKKTEELEVRSKKTRSKKKNIEFSLLKEDIEVGNLQHEKKQLEKERDYLHCQQQQFINESMELKKRIDKVEGTSTELERQQKLSKDNLDRAKKEEATPEERSRVQKNESIQELKSMLTELESQQEKLEDNLVHERRNALHELNSRILAEKEVAKMKMKRRRGIFFSKKKEEDNYYIKLRLEQVTASQKELEEKLQEKNEYLNEILLTGKKEANPQGMLLRFLLDAGLDNPTCQRDTAINGMDELESVIAESVDTGIYSSITSTSYFENPFVGNEEQLTPDLKVAVTVTVKGAHMHIPDTGVELDIPAGAVRHKQLIEMTIIPFDKQFAPIANFSSNSSVAVELLPNKAIFRLPVHLKLPHCLQLKTNYKEIKYPVKVFVSHHEAGPPVWEEDASAKCTLEEDHCVIHLKRFCWVKYEINDKIVVAKRLKVFTAGKSLHANDCIAEIEVGYHMDLPGREEKMTASLGMEFCQNKPFVFVKEGEFPLQLVLSKIVPKEWTYITPDENPKTISYKSVADDKDTSCPFALEKSRSSERKPYCIFKIVQGNESVELSMRF